MTHPDIAQQLRDTGVCVCPDFLGSRSLARAANDLDQTRNDGHFHKAGVGQGPQQNQKTEARHDETFWLDRKTENQLQQLLWQKLEQLKTVFNHNLFLGLRDIESHYSFYPKGGSYDRHLDCFRGSSKRVISLIIYLNRSWQSADGGRLRIYSGAPGPTETYADVDPIGGTMVCFLSGESEHEVLVTHQARTSVTAWFKR